MRSTGPWIVDNNIILKNEGNKMTFTAKSIIFLLFFINIHTVTSAQDNVEVLFENNNIKYKKNNEEKILTLQEVKDNLIIDKPKTIELSSTYIRTKKQENILIEINNKLELSSNVTHLTLKNNDNDDDANWKTVYMKTNGAILNLPNLMELNFTGVIIKDITLTNLKNLERLTLKNIEFFEDYWEEGTKEIKFNVFLKSLVPIKDSIEFLDFSDSLIIPNMKSRNKYNLNYNNWCEKQVFECAEILASNFEGEIYIRNSGIGGNFVDKFKDVLISRNSLGFSKIDLSDNSISLQDAKNFLYGIHQLHGRVNIDFSGNDLPPIRRKKKDSRDFNTELIESLKNELLENFLSNITID